jgi:hypothetical protein
MRFLIGAGRRAFVAASAVLALGAFAAPAYAQDQHTFSGVVRDRNGHGLANQWVTLNGMPSVGANTAADGSFSLSAPPGVYTLGLSANLMAPVSGTDVPQVPSTYSLSGPQIDLSSGDVHQDLTVPSVSLEVNVQDPDGNPAPNSFANVLQTQSSMPGMPPFATSSVSTTVDLYPGGASTGYYSAFGGADATGHVRLVLLPSTNLSVFASPASGSPFAASTTDIGAVTGDTSVTVRLTSTHTFTGTVRDGAGRPLANQQVSLSGALTGAGAITSDDGSFTVHAAPGLYTLTLSRNPSAPSLPSGGQAPETYQLSGPQIDLSSGDAHQDLTLRSVVLDVSVLDPDGNPVPGTSVTLLAEQPGPMPGMPPFLTSLINTSAELYPGGSATGYYTSFATADGSGHAPVVMFPGDNFKVQAFAPVGSQFASVVADVGPVTGDRSITVHLGGTHTFSGTLRDRDGHPLANQQVALSGDPFSVGATTASDGTFTMHAAPGVYTLNLAGNNFGSSALAPSSYNVSGPQVDLTNGDVHQDLTLPTVTVDVTVLDDSGSRISGAFVSVQQEQASGMPGMPPFITGSPSATVELYPGATATGSYTTFGQTDASGSTRLVIFASANLILSASIPNRTSISERIGDVTRDMSVTIPRNTTPRDTSPPVITPHIVGTNVVGDWYTTDVSVTWSVTDPESGVGSTNGCGATTIVQDTTGTTLTCSATNGDGVSTQQSVTVKRDATAPQITGAIAPTAPDGANGWYVTAPRVTFSCNDATSLIASCTAVGETGSSKTLGEASFAQSLGGRAVDNAGNFTTTSVGPVQVDLTDPAITCPSAPAFLLGQVGAQVTVSVSDSASGPVAASLTNNVPTNAVGTFATIFTARDNAGRVSTRACSYSVVYNWSGFFAPASAALNQAQAGAAIPLMFSLKGNQGLAVIASGYPRSQQVACDTGAPTGPDPSAATPGASGLAYDATTDTYTWVWKTDVAWAGTCRRFIVQLNDGTRHSAIFRFG